MAKKKWYQKDISKILWIVLYVALGVLFIWAIWTTFFTDNKPQKKETCSKSVIKGNINMEGEKIYHMPGDKYYSATEIDTSAGERWFCTSKQAEAAGWRHAKV